MPTKVIAFMAGVWSVILGLVYVYRIYGDMEAEVVVWGQAAVLLGVALLISAGVQLLYSGRGVGLGLLVTLIIATLQLPAIYFWGFFLGSPITDAPSTEPVSGNIFYVLPHIGLLAVSFLLFYGLLQIWRQERWQAHKLHSPKNIKNSV
jgi:hypothetical protein